MSSRPNLALARFPSFGQNRTVRTAIILAAGRGKPLGQVTEREPKCFLRVGPLTLLEHQLQALARSGASSAVVVTRYRTAVPVEDLRRPREEVWPTIEGRHRSAAPAGVSAAVAAGNPSGVPCN